MRGGGGSRTMGKARTPLPNRSVVSKIPHKKPCKRSPIKMGNDIAGREQARVPNTIGDRGEGGTWLHPLPARIRAWTARQIAVEISNFGLIGARKLRFFLPDVASAMTS